MKLRAWFPITIFVLLSAAACGNSLSVAPEVLTDQEFAQLSIELSEPPGFFDTDNLISNENSFQHVVPALRRLVAPGGAYLGVGPDQNFTYIAHTDPLIAFIIDIRRDNLLQHLYFKQLFLRSENRWQFLSNLLGRRLPSSFTPSPDADAMALCLTIDQAPFDPGFAAGILDSAWKVLRKRFPALVHPTDRSSLGRLAEPFFEKGLNLKFRSYGRPPRRNYPTLGELLTERDLDGRQSSYLASEEAYARVRRMQLENRIIPVVGDLAGPTALRRIGEWLKQHGLKVSTFYTSNVEFYLFNNQTFGRFAANVASLPVAEDSLLIRSYFSYWRPEHPETVPGYPVTSLVQRIPVFLKRQQERPSRDYLQLIFFDFVPNYSAR